MNRKKRKTTKTTKKNTSKVVASHLCNHCHKVCGRGLVVQSLTGFDPQDAAVPIDGKFGKW